MRRHIDKHLNQLKEKPEHVRHNVALGASVGVTAIVAVIWAVSHAASGTFALTSPNASDSEEPSTFADTQGNFKDLLGAVSEGFGATSTNSELTIVDGNTTSTIQPGTAAVSASDATVIPF
ncbi:MAG TPA: hypothetical protein VGB97_00765 [Candidatus Paceibacterota bacterium]|jgi:tRNA A37 threonylcarbamoyladenosine synthetase subunit TsaC/SUA5/YrdC